MSEQNSDQQGDDFDRAWPTTIHESTRGRPHASKSLLQEPELLAHLGPADLRIADGRLNRRCALLGDMPEIVRDLFQRPPGVTRPMGEVMPGLHPLGGKGLKRA